VRFVALVSRTIIGPAHMDSDFSTPVIRFVPPAFGSPGPSFKTQKMLILLGLA